MSKQYHKKKKSLLCEDEKGASTLESLVKNTKVI